MLFALGLLAAVVVVAALLVNYAASRRGYEQLREEALVTPGAGRS